MQEHENVSKIVKDVIREYKNKDKQDDRKIINLKKQLNDDELDLDDHFQNENERQLSRDEAIHDQRLHNTFTSERLLTDEKTYFKKK